MPGRLYDWGDFMKYAPEKCGDSIVNGPNECNSLTPAADPAMMSLAMSVGEETLNLFDAVIAAIELDFGNDERRAVQMTMAHYAIKIQRATRAALTLIVAGQGQEAMSLIREQNEYVIALNYYYKHPDQAVLYLSPRC